MQSVTVLGDIGRENGLAVLDAPGIFRHQMTGAALRGSGIRRAVVEGPDARQVLAGIQGPMDMATLAIIKDDEIAFVGQQLATQGFCERIGPTGSETQQRDGNPE